MASIDRSDVAGMSSIHRCWRPKSGCCTCRFHSSARHSILSTPRWCAQQFFLQLASVKPVRLQASRSRCRGSLSLVARIPTFGGALRHPGCRTTSLAVVRNAQDGVSRCEQTGDSSQSQETLGGCTPTSARSFAPTGSTPPAEPTRLFTRRLIPSPSLTAFAQRSVELARMDAPLPLWRSFTSTSQEGKQILQRVHLDPLGVSRDGPVRAGARVGDSNFGEHRLASVCRDVVAIPFQSSLRPEEPAAIAAHYNKSILGAAQAKGP